MGTPIIYSTLQESAASTIEKTMTLQVIILHLIFFAFIL